MKKVAIGGGQGFWGDSPDAAIHMIRNADIQYMGCDYLAELTLSIMAKQQLKDPTKGFVPDFTTRILKEAGKEAWDKHIKICTNAGGMNINGCVDGIRQWAEGNSMSGYKIGYVTGDNIKDKIPQLLKDGWTFPNFDYDGNFNDILLVFQVGTVFHIDAGIVEAIPHFGRLLSLLLQYSLRTDFARKIQTDDQPCTDRKAWDCGNLRQPAEQSHKQQNGCDQQAREQLQTLKSIVFYPEHPQDRGSVEQNRGLKMVFRALHPVSPLFQMPIHKVTDQFFDRRLLEHIVCMLRTLQ